MSNLSKNIISKDGPTNDLERLVSNMSGSEYPVEPTFGLGKEIKKIDQNGSGGIEIPSFTDSDIGKVLGVAFINDEVTVVEEQIVSQSGDNAFSGYDWNEILALLFPHADIEREWSELMSNLVASEGTGIIIYDNGNPLEAEVIPVPADNDYCCLKRGTILYYSNGTIAHGVAIPEFPFTLSIAVQLETGHTGLAWISSNND